MNIYIGADHRGFAMKEGIVAWLTQEGYMVEDMGAQEFAEGDDYPDYAVSVAQKIAQDPENTRGILLCGSGVGVAVAANKIAGVRAANIQSVDVAKTARNDDDINALCLGADLLALDEAKAIIATFLDTPFSGLERHERRVEKIKKLEQ